MEWRSDAIVLGVSTHGESDALLDVLTEERGRFRGFVKGGNSKRQKALLQPGNRIAAVWRSRIPENLGRFTVEGVSSPLAGLLGSRYRLSALSAMTSVLISSLPEREAHADIFHTVSALLVILEDGSEAQIAAALVKLEQGILQELGYGLDLSVCAATGQPGDLVYVSPKTARAVSRLAGAPYHDKLLALPPFMWGKNPEQHVEKHPEKQIGADFYDLLQGFDLTGYFLGRQVWISTKSGMPSARGRFLDLLRKKTQKLT